MCIVAIGRQVGKTAVVQKEDFLPLLTPSFSRCSIGANSSTSSSCCSWVVICVGTSATTLALHSREDSVQHDNSHPSLNIQWTRDFHDIEDINWCSGKQQAHGGLNTYLEWVARPACFKARPYLLFATTSAMAALGSVAF